MSAPFNGAALAARPKDPRPTGSRVHRCSVLVYPVVPEFLGDGVGWRMRLGIADWAKELRPPGKVPGGPGTIGRVAQKVAEVLIWFADTLGKVEPGWKVIAKWAGCSVSSVGRALRQLEDLKIITRERRIDLTGKPGLRGPQVRQVTNLYRLRMPRRLAELISRIVQRRGPRTDAAGEHQAGALARDHEAGMTQAAELDRAEARAKAAARTVRRAVDPAVNAAIDGGGSSRTRFRSSQ